MKKQNYQLRIVITQGKEVLAEVFLSTLSLRRATQVDKAGKYQIVNFYPRSPCGERLCI